MPVAFTFASDTIGQSDYDGLMEAIGRQDLGRSSLQLRR
jgi:hypothetical protein